MRPGRILMVMAGLLLTVPPSFGAEGKNFALILKGSLTTGSQLFPAPNSLDEFQRAQYYEIKDALGYGLELRYRFPESSLSLGISAEDLRAKESVSGYSFPVEDGYRVIPVELTGYFMIPLSGETFGIYIGGGAGAYFGHRIYRKANVEAVTTDRGTGFGIHVLSGVSYRLTQVFSLNAELKFRDLQFTSVNKFSSPLIPYGSGYVRVETDALESRVNTDGMIIQLGAMFEF
jgi:opacity protein-like surface antigen